MKSTRSEPDVESVTDTAFDNTGTSNPDVPLLVDHLFRRRATQMTATLVRILGAGRVDLAEEVVQEAMIEALRRWPFHGVPKNPGAWLIQVAKNKALDRLRRVGVRRDKEDEVERVFQRRARAEDLDQRFRDDELRLLFLTCHPALPREARIALTLKVAVGLGTAEIARAFLLREATVAGRIVRAKRTLRELGPDVVVPTHDDLSPRLDSVLDVLYLAFNEGYAASLGDGLLRQDLCAEAIRLGGLLLGEPRTAHPNVHALLALMCLQAARFGTRGDETDLVLLRDQDRAQWDRRLITRGMRHLDHAIAGDEISRWHVEAALAAEHATAPSWRDTNWRRIVELYDDLHRLAPSPVVALNRAVAVAQRDGATSGLAALAELADDPRLDGFHRLHAVEAELLVDLGERERAREAFTRALACPCSAAERAYLERRVATLLQS